MIQNLLPWADSLLLRVAARVNGPGSGTSAHIRKNLQNLLPNKQLPNKSPQILWPSSFWVTRQPFLTFGRARGCLCCGHRHLLHSV